MDTRGTLVPAFQEHRPQLALVTLPYLKSHFEGHCSEQWLDLEERLDG